MPELEDLALQIDDSALTRELCSPGRGGLHEFIRTFWPVVEPGAIFRDEWFIGAIAEHLEAVSCREIKELVISVPPGSGKTTIVSIMWPAWHWTFDPAHRWLAASYDDGIATKAASKMIEVVSSPSYCEAWPELQFDPKKKRLKEFANKHGGTRVSTTIGGGTTGKHAHTQFVDDPMKASEARNSKAHEDKRVWWNETMSTRTAKDRGADYIARLVVMQRLAENDLAGVCLEQGYEHLCLPMRYVPNPWWDRGSTLPKQDPRTIPGQILTAAHSEETLALDEKRLGSAQAVEAQFQQNPIPDKGGIVEKDWLTRRIWTWEQLGKLEKLRWFQSWDFGFKGENSGHSRVHGALWAADFKGNAFLIDEIEPKHINYVDSKIEFKKAQNRPNWSRAKMKLVEDKANGPAIMVDLKGDVIGMHPVEPDGSKEERLIRHSDAIQAGCVWMPPNTAMVSVNAFVHEIVSFPAGAYDDRVDTTTQALDHCFSGRQKKVKDQMRRIKEKLATGQSIMRRWSL